MLDFLMINERNVKKGELEIYPDFKVGKVKDLMIRGRDFYAVWDEENGLWSTDEDRLIKMVDKEIRKRVEERKKTFDGRVKGSYMGVSGTRAINHWHMYCQKDMRDNFVSLNENLIFANMECKKEDYVSKKLKYSLEEGDYSSWDELIGTLYSEEERRKIEWAIGAIVTGESKKLQKFMVMYGDRGTGKSTIIQVIEKLFDGFVSAFDAKVLGNSNAEFALEAFKNNPLVAIQHDGDLSRIDDNTRLNSVVSHEVMLVNEKFKPPYNTRFHSFLIMGANSPVKITDSKSGILRRLIDVSPTGNLVEAERYLYLMGNIDFELGAIAYHCREVYLKYGKHYYDKYVPLTMLGETNDFYIFMEDNYETFKKNDGVTQKAAWNLYKEYCDDANVPYPYSLKVFKRELKAYFKEVKDQYRLDDGSRVRNYYHGFKTEKFDYIFLKEQSEEEKKAPGYVIDFSYTESLFDKEFADCPAQYANDDGKPLTVWDKVRTVLSDLDTSKVHYIRPPVYLICIDFDLKNEKGEKDFILNLEAASKWKPTYAELSKSGTAIHLYYIYNGDVNALSRVFDEDIEIKVFTGKSSLRRKVSKCNNLPIATLTGGLPLKEVKNTVAKKTIEDERHLKNLVIKALKKEVEPGHTVTSINFIQHILEDAYESGLYYDLTPMRPDILAFAMGSTNNAEYCVKQVGRMKFKSEEPSEPVDTKDDDYVFFDVEVFPNLFVVVWKKAGNKNLVVMINPSPEEVETLLQYKLIGFNNRKYDNHIIWAAMMGYTPYGLYQLSQRIINKSENCFFGEAYNISFADIYEFSSKKQSLKKWEIQLGIHHKELGLPWDKEVPNDLWNEVAEYCKYDVLATEATFYACKQDFIAREMLADISGLKVNDTTRMHTTKIIFGNNKNPKLVYTDLSVMFPGYKYDGYKSTYRGEDPGEGGYVYAEPGMHFNVALLDIASMHPTSIINLNLFGEYTKNYEDILDARLAIKHGNFDKVQNLFDGKLAKYLESKEQASDLAYALKIIINSVYGYTTATFPNPFKDPKNIDNIVAKRGALFMINLKHEVQARGFTVAHIKTDSIKIPDATPEIISFVMDYGRQYGYTFEHEATYERMCLVNNAVYIAKYAGADDCLANYGYIPSDCRKHGGEWTATGTQFQIPYVFKTLFSKEPIEFDDLCETKSVTTALYLDCREGLNNVEIWEELKAARDLIPEKRTRKQQRLVDEHSDLSDKGLDEFIAEGHNYIFVGRVGRFCPMKPSCGAGYLMREKDGKFTAATGTKGYLWMESETVKTLGLEDKIDRKYYISLVDDAIATISEYGDFEWFVSDDVVAAA